MNKLIPIVLAAALAAPAVAAEKLQLVERAVNETVLDLGATGDSKGDMLTFANPIFDAANSKQIGTDQGFCVRIEVGKSWECTFSLALKGGQFSVEGPFNDQGDSLFAVIGGTGRFAGARGSLKLHPRPAKDAMAFDFGVDLL